MTKYMLITGKLPLFYFFSKTFYYLIGRMIEQEGYFAFHIYKVKPFTKVLFMMFNTENEAKIARNNLSSEGFNIGEDILPLQVEEDN